MTKRHSKAAVPIVRANDSSPAMLPPFAVSSREGARLLGISRSHFMKLYYEGSIPAPIKLGGKCPRWVISELRAWVLVGAPSREAWERMQESAVGVSPRQVAVASTG